MYCHPIYNLWYCKVPSTDTQWSGTGSKLLVPLVPYWKLAEIEKPGAESGLMQE